MKKRESLIIFIFWLILIRDFRYWTCTYLYWRNLRVRESGRNRVGTLVRTFYVFRCEDVERKTLSIAYYMWMFFIFHSLLSLSSESQNLKVSKCQFVFTFQYSLIYGVLMRERTWENEKRKKWREKEKEKENKKETREMREEKREKPLLSSQHAEYFVGTA